MGHGGTAACAGVSIQLLFLTALTVSSTAADELEMEYLPVAKLFVTVRGGCAYVMEDTVPPGCLVEIIDFDNINVGAEFPSREAREYCSKHGLYITPTAE